MAQLNTRIILRNDSSTNWLSNKDQVLLKGEVGFEFQESGKVKMKVGDGVKTWEQLEYFGGEELAGDGKSIIIAEKQIQLKGFDTAEPGARLVKGEDGSISWELPDTSTVEDLAARVAALESKVSTVYTYKGSVQNFSELPVEGNQIGDVWNIASASLSDGINAGDNVAWNGTEWDKLAGIVDLSAYAEKTQVEKLENDFKKIAAEVEAKRFEISGTPEGTLVRMNENEIRVMCPADAKFTKQNVGVGGDSNSYYITLKTYAPSDDVVGYKETLGTQEDPEILTDLKVDANGRKYQLTWFPAAKYDEATDTWSYHGKNSTTKKFIGWNYKIDWFNAENLKIASDSIRINLSNEDCHDVIEPYYMASINVNKLTQNEGEYLILYGGSATDNI